MSNDFLKFVGVLLLLGSVGFVTVKSLFTGGVMFFAAEIANSDGRPANLR